MCYCNPSKPLGCCGNWGCYPYQFVKAPNIITTDHTTPYINLKAPVTPIHANTMDKVPDKLVEYLNKAIKAHWDGDKARINVETIREDTKLAVNYQKILDLFRNYGWDVDYKTTEDNDYLVFTIEK